MRRQRDVDEGDQVEAERFAGKARAIAGDHLFLFQPGAAPRALRRGEADNARELLVGEPAIVLQGGEDFEIEGVDVNHA